MSFPSPRKNIAESLLSQLCHSEGGLWRHYEGGAIATSPRYFCFTNSEHLSVDELGPEFVFDTLERMTIAGNLRHLVQLPKMTRRKRIMATAK